MTEIESDEHDITEKMESEQFSKTLTLRPDPSTCSQSTQIPDLFFDFMPELRVLRIMNAPITSLPKTLSDLHHLESLDVSVTEIHPFPANVIFKLTSLKRLNWNQCAFNWPDGLFDNRSGATIYACNAKFFEPLIIDDSPLPELFKKFRFFVFSPDGVLDNDHYFRTRRFIYNRIYLRCKHFTSSIDHERCLEIKGCVESWDVIKGVLNHVQFLSLRQTSLSKLSELGIGNLKGLKEFCIERCEGIETIANGEDRILESLENLWISSVPNLTSVCMGNVGAGSFACLKNVYLECCPKLKYVFTSGSMVKTLESLDIKYCSKLERIFGEEGEHGLPSLKSLILWELPEFESICDGGLPALEKLRVRECRNLKKLPLDGKNRKDSLKIIGEETWWGNLVWENEGIKSLLSFKKWGRF